MVCKTYKHGNTKGQNKNKGEEEYRKAKLRIYTPIYAALMLPSHCLFYIHPQVKMGCRKELCQASRKKRQKEVKS